jgi:hypothetical protein
MPTDQKDNNCKFSRIMRAEAAHRVYTNSFQLRALLIPPIKAGLPVFQRN